MLAAAAAGPSGPTAVRPVVGNVRTASVSVCPPAGPPRDGGTPAAGRSMLLGTGELVMAVDGAAVVVCGHGSGTWVARRANPAGLASGREIDVEVDWFGTLELVTGADMVVGAKVVAAPADGGPPAMLAEVGAALAVSNGGVSDVAGASEVVDDTTLVGVVVIAALVVVEVLAVVGEVVEAHGPVVVVWPTSVVDVVSVIVVVVVVGAGWRNVSSGSPTMLIASLA